MKKWKTRGVSLLLALAVMVSLFIPAQAAVSQADISAAVTDTAAYLQRTVSSPQVGSIGGEWAVLGLARSGVNVPDSYFQNYYSVVEKYVKDCGGVLHERKYTEYSRVIVALTAIGKDARSVAGYDLTKALGDFDKTVWQGLNGPIWALIALDSANYPMPSGGATRQMYVDYILDKQLPDGGWNLTSDGTSDPDITGMALQALANYQDQKAVSTAIQSALACMSQQQNSNGGYSSVESTVQMVVGLTALGISLDDSRFVKNGKSLLDDLMSYYTNGVIFPTATVTFYEGESVFNVLQRETRKAKIHMEFSNTPAYNSAYIEGIHNLYEFDCGDGSGWLYAVNGWYPNYGCSRYQLQPGDSIEFVYTCTLGREERATAAMGG